MGDDRHQAYIVINGPGHDGTTVQLREGITSFGRLPSNDMILLGDLVSRHHSRITFFEGRATLQDLGSHNGSWVNGDKVQTRVLKEGDVARVGNFRLNFFVGTPDQARSGAAYDETTAAEQSSSAAGLPRQTPSISHSVLIQQIEAARAGAGSGAMHLLYRASDALANAVDVPSYLREILSLALEQIPADICAYIENDDHTHVVCALGPDGPIPNPGVSTTVVRWVLTKNFPVTTDDVQSDLRFGGPPSGVVSSLAVLCVPVADEGQVSGALYMGRNSGPFADADLDALSAIAHLCVVGIERAQARQSEAVRGASRETLARFMSPDVVDLITQGRPKLKGVTATVMSGELPGFTNLIERVSVDHVTEFLGKYVETATELIHRHRGTLESVVGARILATFGAPVSHGNDPARAIACAVELRAAIDALAKARPAFAHLRPTFGLDTGWMLAGVVGTSERPTYTVIGDTVAGALRLEASGAPGALLISEATSSAVQQVFETRKLGQTQVRGRSDPVKVYEVVGRRGGKRR